MRLPKPLHGWDVTPGEAVALQRRLAGRLRVEPPPRPPRLVGGLDAAFSPDGTRCIAGVVLWDLERAEAVEAHAVRVPLRFPYIPGLLSFREAPGLLAALARLRRQPDVLLCDGQGLAHPRRMGIACHVGLLSGLPAVGCAKSRLTGAFEAPPRERGAWTSLVDRGETVGAVLRTRTGVRPVFVSVGHRFDLPSALSLVLRCAPRYRIPEPTRRADRLVAEARVRRRPLP